VLLLLHRLESKLLQIQGNYRYADKLYLGPKAQPHIPACLKVSAMQNTGVTLLRPSSATGMFSCLQIFVRHSCNVHAAGKCTKHGLPQSAPSICMQITSLPAIRHCQQATQRRTAAYPCVAGRPGGVEHIQDPQQNRAMQLPAQSVFILCTCACNA
jgi:hypothetical protein